VHQVVYLKELLPGTLNMIQIMLVFSHSEKVSKAKQLTSN
jgi:hypothetical protein